ncbi:MAG: hypothetical protein PWQ83_178 [Thermosipho sp. (in: thermotogales)]|jgi:hypothetical protein|nr:hypothetical protein [Thermosipho sp. (in: thermotogales)]
MENHKLLILQDTIKLIIKIRNYEFLKEEDKKAIKNFYLKFRKLYGRTLVKYVYEKFPYYASKSKIRDNLTYEEYTEKKNMNKEKVFQL